MIARAARWLGIDGTVSYGAARVMVSSVGGLVTTVLATRLMSAEAQGYFATFYAAFALQGIIQNSAYVPLLSQISREWGRAGAAGESEADRSRLSGLYRLSRQWHAACAILFTLGCGVVGHIFFSLHATAVPWRLAWWLLVVTLGASFLILPRSLALEATGRTNEQQRAMFWGAVASLIACFAALAFGLGLHALAATTIGRILVTRLLLSPVADSALTSAKISWKEEVWPQQSRIMVSWLTGFIFFQSLVPVTFQMLGGPAAARVGIAVQIYAAVNSIAMIWLIQMQPRLGAMIGARDLSDGARLMRMTARRAASTAALAALGSLGVLYGVQVLFPAYAHRLPSLWTVVALMVIAVEVQYASVWTAAVRLTGREPFVRLNVAVAAAFVLALIGALHLMGEPGVGLAFLVVNGALLVPGTWIIYRRHSPLIAPRDAPA